MTINREAAEQMAARLTSTIASAVDVADTFNEALRLATVALQEPREVPEIAPGTVGTATVQGVEGVRVMRTDGTSGADTFWITPCHVKSHRLHVERQVTDFVPDPETTALRAEVERLNGELESERHAVETQSGLYQGLAKWAKGQRDRAGAAEARLARVTRKAVRDALFSAQGYQKDVSDSIDAILALVAADEQAAEGHAPDVLPTQQRIAEALKTAYTQIHNQDPLRKYAVSEVKQIVYPILSLLEEFGFHEVEGERQTRTP